MKSIVLLGAGIASLALSGFPVHAGYPESKGMGCSYGYIKTNNGTYCANIKTDSGYPESKGMGCHAGYRKVANNTYCARY